MEKVNSKAVSFVTFSNPLEKDDSWNTLIGKHDSAMRKKNSYAELQQVYQGAFSHWPFDATIFIGDLNYRLDLPG